MSAAFTITFSIVLKNRKKYTIFGNKSLASSGEDTKLKRELNKNVETHISVLRTRQNTPKVSVQKTQRKFF
jgi:hypothetical protein